MNNTIKAGLIKLVIQPYIVADDGETLREIPTQPNEISAADLANLPAQIEQDLKALEKQLNSPAKDQKVLKP